MMKNKKRYRKVLSICTLLVGLLCLEMYHSKYMLSVTHYTISLESKKQDSHIRILQLTDLHNSLFGERNVKLLSMVKSQEPDIIFFTGDLLNSHKYNGTEQVIELLEELVKIAPVYISLGNQEKSLMMQNGSSKLIEEFDQTGAKTLDFSYDDIMINGERYRIGGIYGYCRPVAHAMESHSENESEFLKDFQDTDACKLLLCHMPYSWIESYSLYDWDVDIVFSGHVHGGQIRIPLIGGLWAPDQGWFPGQLSGVYATNKKDWERSRKKLKDFANYKKYDSSYYENQSEYRTSYLILSRGLGNTDFVPRINNVPEIVVVDISHT